MARNSEEYYTEKVVIVNGPSLWTTLKLIVFGAAVGSAGTFYWLRHNSGAAPAIELADDKRHFKDWWQRGVQLVSMVAELVKSTFPQWQEAVNTAKATAEQTEQQLQHQIEESDE